MGWINKGDLNSSYYHMKTIIKSRNKFNMLRNSNGIWVEQKEALLDLISGFLKNIFNQEKGTRRLADIIVKLPKIEYY